MQESITYSLVTKFNIVPNIMRAEMDESGGKMMMKIIGEEKNIKAALEYLDSLNISVKELGKHISRAQDLCIDCGSCVSICPSRAFSIDPETWEVLLNSDKCVACGSCLTACPTHAVNLIL